jgi:hypothetical protein
MAQRSTLRGLAARPLAPEPGDVTCILKDAAELASLADTPSSSPELPPLSKGGTLRMIPAAPLSSGVVLKRDSRPSMEPAHPSSGLVLLPHAPVITLKPLPSIAPPSRKPSRRGLRVALWILAAVLAAANVVAGGWLLAR